MSNEKHFKLRKDLSIEVGGVKLFRIEATKDIEQHGVEAGDLGGYVEKEENLSGSAWVFGSAKVFGSAWVFGSAKVGGSAEVSGEAKVGGSAEVSGEAKVGGSAWVSGEAKVGGSAWVNGSAKVGGSAKVSGSAEVSGDKVQSFADCRNIVNERYNITILPKNMQIGCQYHSKKEWWGFTDREIIEMDGKDGLKWWKKWKPILQAICDVEGK